MIDPNPKTESDRASEILSPYRKTISKNAGLLSLLYDADMLPEQTVTVRGAITVAVAAEAWTLSRSEMKVEENAAALLNSGDLTPAAEAAGIEIEKARAFLQHLSAGPNLL